MNIHDFLEKIKSWLGTEAGQDALFISILVLVGLASFGLGRLSKTMDTQARVVISGGIPFESQQVDTQAIAAADSSGQGVVFASKTGTRYYYPHCKSQVKEQNKIWFKSIEEALATGLTLASGCK